MNNIEILEEFINQYNTDEDLFCFVNYSTIQAIENLIKENKELKKKAYKKEYYEEVADVLHKDSIPKSKVKEKIEEIKARMNNDCIALHEFQREAKIEVLEELLKEGE